MAGERCFGVANLLYYEDYPYVRDAEALEAALRIDHAQRWEAQVIALNEAALQAKVAAVAAYESQVSSFFTGPLDLEMQIKAHAQQVLEESPRAASDAPATAAGAERVWQRNYSQ
jgi:hypothetical protein